MLIGTAPNQVDITKVGTRRLLVYKKKHYSHNKCFNRSSDYACEWCEKNDIDEFTACKQYESERQAIKDELDKREHIENK